MAIDFACGSRNLMTLADLGDVPGARPPYGTQFFHFCTHFHQKVPVLEVHAPPQWVHAPPPPPPPPPPTGNT